MKAFRYLSYPTKFTTLKKYLSGRPDKLDIRVQIDLAKEYRILKGNNSHWMSKYKQRCSTVYIYVSFLLLAHESRDLSESETKIIVVTSWVNQLFSVNMVRFEEITHFKVWVKIVVNFNLVSFPFCRSYCLQMRDWRPILLWSIV